jgi:sugar phosphate isomerase/epimerase
MSSRRRFLGTLASGLGVAALRPCFTSAASAPEVKSPLGGPIGLQLYSLRDYLYVADKERKVTPKDVPGTLARLRSLGVREVESAGTAGLSTEAFRAELDKADLVCRAAHIGFERVRDDTAGAVKEAKTLGAKNVVVAWIPHDGKAGFKRDDALRAAEAFNKAGKVAKDEGVRVCYHCHGYEFVPATEGTLFDTIAKQTDPAFVSFEIDIYWAKAGGADPAQVIAAYPGRVPLMHIKDMVKGLSLPQGTSQTPHETNVPAGAGQLDLPAIFRAARKSGTEIYYIEDESPKVWEQIPESLKYLSSLKL